MVKILRRVRKNTSFRLTKKKLLVQNQFRFKKIIKSRKLIIWYISNVRLKNLNLIYIKLRFFKIKIQALIRDNIPNKLIKYYSIICDNVMTNHDRFCHFFLKSIEKSNL
jgi:hypothetical protein